jgi:hypothetical protein
MHGTTTDGSITGFVRGSSAAEFRRRGLFLPKLFVSHKTGEES